MAQLSMMGMPLLRFARSIFGIYLQLLINLMTFGLKHFMHLWHTPPDFLTLRWLAASCEKNISEEEFFMALQSLKNGKAPGLDGIIKEFVMAFWPLLKNLILDVCNEIWKDQKIPYSFKMGKIKLIPKMEVPRRIGDWRPITMMSIIYKIFAEVFALRLKCIIHKIVHPSQIGLSAPFPIERSVRQGCPLSSLFYALASSPMFYLLEANVNSQSSTFNINMRKSAIINISAQNFQAIEWEGAKIERGVGVPIKDKIDWVLRRVKCKMDKWFASQWPLHARIRIVQAFMQPYVMYYLLLLDWKKNQLHIFDRLIKAFLWSKRHDRALVLSSWEYVCQPKDKGGLGILNLHAHLMARRTAFIMRIVSSHTPLWTPLFWKFVENADVKFKGTWKLDAWNKFFSHAPLQTSSHTINILLCHFKTTLSTLRWNGRQRYVGNSLAWELSCFSIALLILPFSVLQKTYALGAAYRSKWLQIVSFLQQYQIPLSVDAVDQWRDWLLAKHTRWWAGKSNMYYRTLIASDSIACQCNRRWNLRKTASWCCSRFSSIWESSFTYKTKIFMWRTFVGHFTLGAFLSKHGLQGVRCPHCASYAENMRHAFWSCAHVQRWWSTLFLFPIWNTKPTKFGCTFLLFDSTNTAEDWIKRRCVFLLLRNIWMLRNFKMFKNKM
ncbi:hypothetical protein KP509_33G034500 [Ceratopteris richardii]|uniref:Reverse transcriptase zinc-binding domain-containing protein n=1 Tax=Ceratopteris richardii TaxID=49495 RepID=A0A8T2QQE0_CERRI|nr:hypothetical protein KP509_33G034500 [Ceratopteris richardii]